MTTYEQITYRVAKGTSRVILKNPVIVPFLGHQAITGVAVDRVGDEVAPEGVDIHRHIIQMDLVIRRTPMVMNNFYGKLYAQR